MLPVAILVVLGYSNLNRCQLNYFMDFMELNGLNIGWAFSCLLFPLWQPCPSRWTVEMVDRIWSPGARLMKGRVSGTE